MGATDIKTNRLLLRQFRISDSIRIHELLGVDPDFTRFTGWNPYASPEMARATISEFIDKYDEDHFYSWGIEWNGELIGTIGAYDFCAEDNSIEIGYSIGKEFWGNGFASEACSAVSRYLIENEKISIIKAWVVTENVGSAKVLQNSGFILKESQMEEVNGTMMRKDYYVSVE